MKKFAYPLLYTALACFIATIFANVLLHKPYIAVWAFLAAVIFLIFGIVSLVNRNADNMGSNKYTPAKIATTLIYVSSIAIPSALLLRILHFRIIGAGIIIAGLVLFIVGIIIAMFSPTPMNKAVLTPIAYRQNIAMKVLTSVALIFLVGGTLLKLEHFPGATWATCIGIILFIIFLVTRFFTKNKKYKILNIPTIYLSPSDLDKYPGSYYNEQLKMTITISKNDAGTSLVAQATGQNSFPLAAIEKDVFNYDQGGIVIEFKPGENKLVLIQRGGYFPFIKSN